MTTVGGNVLYANLTPKNAGYQAIVTFIFIATTCCMIAGTILGSTNNEIKKSGKSDVIAGLMGASTGVIGIFTMYLIFGFYKSENEGFPFQYVTPDCTYSTTKPGETEITPSSTNAGLQTMILAVFFVVFILMLTSIIILNEEISDEDDLRVINGLVGFSLTWIGLFVCIMGYSMKVHGSALYFFSGSKCFKL